MNNTETHRKLYEIFLARDARFDGRFFVGVSSTGIYCRTVCRARMPKEENCTFFSSAAEAEAAGFRPCMTCRPELAPGSSIADASSALAGRAARLIEEDCGSGARLTAIADRLGCSARHLRRVFAEQFHVSPVQYLQTCRLLLAKNLLTDTALSVVDIAMASGFGSLRQFNHAFSERYRTSPAAFRKSVNNSSAAKGSTSILLGYHKPYRFDEMLSFFAARAIPGVEAVRDGMYMRTARLNDAKGRTFCGWLQVENKPSKSALSLTVSDTLIPVLPQVLGRVRLMFDLYCHPSTIRAVLDDMNELKPRHYLDGTRIPGCFEPFEMSVRAVLGQQISVKAAGTLAGRIAESYGFLLETGIPELTRIFPRPSELLQLPGSLRDHLGPLGVIASRSEAIEALARAFEEDSIKFDISAEPEAEIKKLLALKGIGPWTAQYIAMRTMGWTDAFPETDLGIRKALPGYSPKERLALAERWRPWRSYATVSLWNHLEQNK